MPLSDDFFVSLTQKLLDSVVSGDYKTYQSLCADNLTCFESETDGHLVQGMPFHKFFFDLPSDSKPKAPPATVTMSGVHVRRLGDKAAVVAYVRFNQSYTMSLDGKGMDGPLQITKACETRVWEEIDGQWKHVHVHRS
jgi:Calcium/calmodulin dependent protein kinase II association domain